MPVRRERATQMTDSRHDMSKPLPCTFCLRTLIEGSDNPVLRSIPFCVATVHPWTVSKHCCFTDPNTDPNSRVPNRISTRTPSRPAWMSLGPTKASA